jgi:hypothetical protein
LGSKRSEGVFQQLKFKVEYKIEKLENKLEDFTTE